MNYHNITKDDMLNGDGLRVVLWCSGCEHHCHGCQNPQTWDYESGIPFDEEAEKELLSELEHDYISGVTFSGGDPLAYNNLLTIHNLIARIRVEFPNKTIWLYTGATLTPEILLDELQSDPSYETLKARALRMCDVVVDGEYVEEQRDIDLKWRGSSNQRVIDVKKSIAQKEIVLFCD